MWCSPIKSTEDVQQEHIRAMGNELGPIYDALYSEVVWLHAKWLEYRALYAHSPKRIELLNTMAGFFFSVVQRVLWDDVLLHLARLTEQQKTSGKSNLTLWTLADSIAKLQKPSLAEEVHVLVANAVKASRFATPQRNRRLAHRDLSLALALRARPLPGVSRKNVEDALSGIRAVLNRVHAHYYHASEVAFEHTLTTNNAEDLVYYLRVAKRTEEHQIERFQRGEFLPEDQEELPEA